MAGPLSGFKVVELAGIGPGPMAAMLLADLGATVVRVERREPAALGFERPLRFNLLLRNREAVALDLKDPKAVALVLELVAEADALVEGFRPGVTERLGLGPDACLARNPRLVYGRITGWGQDGPMSQRAGHDVNYLAMTGILDAVGGAGQPPSIPLNLLGDFAGGSLYLVLGVLAAVMEARQSGRGQVVDAAIVDGAAHLSGMFLGLMAAGIWKDGPGTRGTNIIDGAMPFYSCYECSDGLFVGVGAVEAKFAAELLRLLEIDPTSLPPAMDKASWPVTRAALAAKFRTRKRDEWAALLEQTDACTSGILSFSEASSHAHMRARGVYREIEGVVQPVAAPRFSRTVPDVPTAPRQADADTALAGWLPPARIAALRTQGIFD
jgi:alpha-methylacyl-CoA racemase